MNDTKWNELFKAFYELERSTDIAIPWMIKTTHGHSSQWESTWTHFGSEPTAYKDIDQLKIQCTPQNEEVVFSMLKKIHIPGERIEDCFIIYGYRSDIPFSISPRKSGKCRYFSRSGIGIQTILSCKPSDVVL